MNIQGLIVILVLALGVLLRWKLLSYITKKTFENLEVVKKDEANIVWLGQQTGFRVYFSNKFVRDEEGNIGIRGNKAKIKQAVNLFSILIVWLVVIAMLFTTYLAISRN